MMANASVASPELPLDILSAIFAPLPLDDWTRCRRVDRTWRAAANRPNVLLQQLTAAGGAPGEADRRDVLALQASMAEVLRSIVNRSRGRCAVEALASTVPLCYGPVVAANGQHTHMVLQSASSAYKIWHCPNSLEPGRLIAMGEAAGVLLCAPVIPGVGARMLTAASAGVTRWELTPEGVATSGTSVMRFNDATTAPLLSPCGGRLATLDASDKLCLWDLTTAPPTCAELMQGIPIFPRTSWMFSESGHLLYVRNAGRCLLWDLTASPPKLHTLHNQDAPVDVVLFNGIGTMLLTCPWRGVYAIWDLASLASQPPTETRLEDGFFWAGDDAGQAGMRAAISKDSSRLLTWADQHATSQLWDLTSRPIRRIAILDGAGGIFSRDSRSLVTFTAGCGCLLWDITSDCPSSFALPMDDAAEWDPLAMDDAVDDALEGGAVGEPDTPAVYHATFSSCSCVLWAWARDGRCWRWDFCEPPVQPPAEPTPEEAYTSAAPDIPPAAGEPLLLVDFAAGSSATTHDAALQPARSLAQANAVPQQPEGAAAKGDVVQHARQPNGAAGVAAELSDAAFQAAGLLLAASVGWQQEQLLRCWSADCRQGKRAKLTDGGVAGDIMRATSLGPAWRPT